MFSDPNMFIDLENKNFDIKQSELNNLRKMTEKQMTEELILNEGNVDLYAHIPQDFNLDIEITGDIRGNNHDYSKFLGS